MALLLGKELADIIPPLPALEKVSKPVVRAMAPEAVISILRNFRKEVSGIDQDSDVVWQSDKLEHFDKSGEIKFLRMSDDGHITLDVFKPGCHFTTYATVSPDLVEGIRTFLTEHPMTKWDHTSAGWYKGKNDKDMAEQSEPGAIFKFTRSRQISKNFKLVWKGRHRNPRITGGHFEVNDALKIESIKPV